MDVFKKTRLNAGSCSACHDRDHTMVYEIDLNNTIIRLCDSCKKELIKKLKKIK